MKEAEAKAKAKDFFRNIEGNSQNIAMKRFKENLPPRNSDPNISNIQRGLCIEVLKNTCLKAGGDNNVSSLLLLTNC